MAMTGGGETAEEAAIVLTVVPAVMAEGAGPGAPAPVGLVGPEDLVVPDRVALAEAVLPVPAVSAGPVARVPAASVIADRAVPVLVALAALAAPRPVVR